MWPLAAAALFVLFRLAYVVGVGTMLTRQRRTQAFTRGHGVEGGYRKFRRVASVIMNVDGIAFVLLCLVTIGTLPPVAPRAALALAGTLLLLAGVGIKTWAALRLGDLAYYWYDFFAPESFAFPDPPGPYRWLDNPMYTLGYLHTYGLALVCASWPGLAASVFAHAGILAFHHVVERPHVRMLVRARRAAAP